MKVKITTPEKNAVDVEKVEQSKLRALSSMYKDKLFVTQWQTLMANMENKAKQGYSSEIYKNIDEKVGEMVKENLRISGYVIEVSGSFPNQIFIIRW